MSAAAPEKTLYRARWVLPIDGPPVRDGGVLVRGTRIEAIGEAVALESGAAAGQVRHVDLGNAALLPGLVNVHAHVELSLLRHVCNQATGFAEWLSQIIRWKYTTLTCADYRLGAAWSSAAALRSGVTTVANPTDQPVAGEELKRAGLRAIVFQEVFGPDPRECDEKFGELTAAVDELRGGATERLSVGVSPHSLYTVSAPLLRRVSEWAAAENLPTTMHVAESPEEVEFVESGTGPLAARLRERDIAVNGSGLSPVAYLAGLGVLESRPLLVHVVNASDADLRCIGAAGVSVAHCPISNARLGHGVARAQEMIELGIPVGLGTDSAASNERWEMWAEARFGALAQRARRELPMTERDEWSPRRMLHLLTLGGAEALGLKDRIGSLRPGKEADLIAVDLGSLTHQPAEDPESAVLYSTTGTDVRLTVVAGEVLFESGKFTRGDPTELQREFEARAAALAKGEEGSCRSSS